MLNLAFNSAGSSVLWADSLWSSNQSWVIYLVSGTTTSFANLTLNMANWQDSGSNLFNATLPGSSFDIAQVGQNIVLNYTAVPEPKVWALIGLGLGFTLFRFRARMRKLDM